MARYIVEAIGTFFLVLTVGLTAIEPGAGQMAPLAIGSVLMVMIFAGGYISGAHYNPAVTLAVWVRGKISPPDAGAYVVAQCIGAALAALAVPAMKELSPTPIAITAAPVLVAEFLFTFALAYVVLNVATAKGMAGNPTYGLAIGFTVLAGAYAVGSISGAAFNPAVVLGLTMLDVLPLQSVWLYLAANLAGGAAAAVVFRYVLRQE